MSLTRSIVKRCYTLLLEVGDAERQIEVLR